MVFKKSSDKIQLDALSPYKYSIRVVQLLVLWVPLRAQRRIFSQPALSIRLFIIREYGGGGILR
jgi:hypothetical protein